MFEISDELRERWRKVVAKYRHIPRPRRSSSAAGTGTTPYGARALANECATVATTTGARNVTLNEAAFRVGQLVGGGQVTRAEAEKQLTDAARECGLFDDEWEAEKTRGTIERALSAGAENPRAPDPRKERERAPFPIDLFPAGVGRFVASAAHSIGCAPEMIALPLLSAWAASIGNTRVFHAGKDWKEPAVLWSAVIAPSGSKKTPAIKKALQFVNEIEVKTFRDYTARMESHKRAMAAYAARKRKRSDPADVPPDEPACPAFMIGDATSEAVIERLSENPRGLLCFHDELAGVFKAMDAYRGGRGGDLERMLEFHNAGTVRVDRKTTGRKVIVVERASVSYTGGIQPGPFRKLVSKNGGEFVENGLLPRFLIAVPPESEFKAHAEPIPAAHEQYMRGVFVGLRSLASDADAGGAPVAMYLDDAGDDDALAFFNGFRRHLFERRRDLHPESPLCSVASKLEGGALRMAGVVQLVRHFDPVELNPDCLYHAPRRRDPRPGAGSIDLSSMVIAVQLAWWFFDEWERIYNHFAPKRADPEELVNRAEAWILDRDGEPFTAREFYLAFRRRFADVQGARDWLAETFVTPGRMELKPDGKTERFTATPQVLTKC